MRFQLAVLLALQCVSLSFCESYDVPNSEEEMLAAIQAEYDRGAEVLPVQRPDIKSTVYPGYTTPQDKNCELAPEARRIKGAVKNHLHTNEGKTICDMECLDLTQSRDWHGFHLIGPTKNFDYKIHCGPTLPLRTCSSGGNGLRANFDGKVDC
ncbi:hypothetical protein ONS95_001264 [Cadophora gregata]|uniref:uncharacterized protein n=1 Tax=Cadophora gregata TaxID=51156 RepID=UPI0026DAFE1C|nr:uncharacterized protein ONS95_001264 [Cadophora gregata]KAK0101923.1 hypothetical protein ONS96_005897 [Cadophora gregata f. sp. sojae]KAK0129335.1 hypothetical protein ONS95_001264 [Cadophora gregata]